MSYPQNAQILGHLKAGHRITSLEALSRFGCLRLSARIYELRKAGHPITDRRIEDPVNEKSYKEYWLSERVSA